MDDGKANTTTIEEFNKNITSIWNCELCVLNIHILWQQI